MCNASAADDDVFAIASSGIGNGIIASSRSSVAAAAATAATGTSNAVAIAAISAGATLAAGAPAGLRIGANRA
jgi:hypothetical protein